MEPPGLRPWAGAPPPRLLMMLTLTLTLMLTLRGAPAEAATRRPARVGSLDASLGPGFSPGFSPSPNTSLSSSTSPATPSADSSIPSNVLNTSLSWQPEPNQTSTWEPGAPQSPSTPEATPPVAVVGTAAAAAATTSPSPVRSLSLTSSPAPTTDTDPDPGTSSPLPDPTAPAAAASETYTDTPADAGTASSEPSASPPTSESPPAPPPADFPSSLLGRVDEYYSGYEYQDPGTNDSAPGAPAREPGVIPDPGVLDEPPEPPPPPPAQPAPEDPAVAATAFRPEPGPGPGLLPPVLEISAAASGPGAAPEEPPEEEPPEEDDEEEEEEEEEDEEEGEGEEGQETDARGVPLQLPDDSLADADLHDHDLIDSVMYIYFGTAPRGRGSAGRQVLAAGAALALLAQLLGLWSAARRLRRRGLAGDSAAAALLHTELALAGGGCAWLLGAPHATARPNRCLAAALLLHWLHAAAACWLLLASLHVLRRLSDAPPPRTRRWAPLAWGLPAAFVAVCYGTSPRSYETRRFCWVSVERGMLFSYLLPVGSLIVANTALTVASLRLLARREAPCKPAALLLLAPPDPELALRRAVRAAAALLPLFAVHWFLAVLALENPGTLALPLAAVAVGCFLNWFLLACSGAVLAPSDARSCAGPNSAAAAAAVGLLCPPAESPARGARTPPPPPPPAAADSDTQPLLSAEPAWAPGSPTARRSRPGPGGELLELRLDAISTISS